MLKKVRIQNYRLFEDFSIDNLARVNLIVGKNNVGKSSLLEALYLLVSQDSPEVLLSLLEARGEVSFADDDYRSRGYAIAHLFFGHKLENGASIVIQSRNLDPLGIRITFVKDIEKLLLPSPKEKSRRRRSPTFLRVEYLGTEIKVDLDLMGDLLLDGFELKRLGILSPAQTNSNYITTKGFDYDFLAKLWDAITLTPKEDDVINMLQILEPDVERISFQSRKTSNSGILIRHAGQDSPVPLGSMGDGMHRVLAIATALANSENGYLFIDEIDTGLHYRTITDLWDLVFKTAERLKVQVFATTHSSDCIESFNKAVNIQQDRELGKLFRLERRGEKIETVKYDNKDLTIATRQEIEVR
jgi:energy-coupling factor transporter ATP-binding protein EcfA2